MKVKEFSATLTPLIVKGTTIIKSKIIAADRKEAKGSVDYMIVIQTMTHLNVRSFMTPFTYQTLNNQMVPIPFQSENTSFIYFLIREGPTVKLQELGFSNTKKNHLDTLYEFKSNKV